MGEIAYEYLDKLFLLGINQPELSVGEIDNYYEKLIEGNIFEFQKKEEVVEVENNYDDVGEEKIIRILKKKIVT